MLFVSLSASVSISISETGLSKITGSVRPSSAKARSQHQTERYNSNLLWPVPVALSRCSLIQTRCRKENTSNCRMAARINLTQKTKSANAIKLHAQKQDARPACTHMLPQDADNAECHKEHAMLARVSSHSHRPYFFSGC